MKNALAILLFLFFVNLLHGQVPVADSSVVVYSWKLTDNYTEMKRVPIDTLLNDFQIFNPIFIHSISNSYLGNLGSPALSNLFFERVESNNFFGISPYLLYMSTSRNTHYINTHKPFTDLTYTNGGAKNVKEESLDAFHSQNINKYFNAGIHYNLISSKGQYAYQQVRKNSFTFFTSYTGKPYSVHSNLNINRIHIDENGGIKEDRFITDTVFQFTKDIPTNFGGTGEPKYSPDVYSSIKNLEVLIVQKLDFGMLKMRKDTTSQNNTRLRYYSPALSYVFNYNRNVKIYNDAYPDSGFYHNSFINSNVTKDSLFYHIFSNALRLEFSKKDGENTRWNALVGLSNDYLVYSYNTPGNKNSLSLPGDSTGIFNYIKSDTTAKGDTVYNIDTRDRLHYTYLTAILTNNFSSTLSSTFSGKYYLEGYAGGSYDLKANIKKLLEWKGNHYNIDASAGLKSMEPGFPYQKYYTNNFIWENNFKPEKSTQLCIKLGSTSNKFDIDLNYSLLRNRIYFDSTGMPRQYSENLSVFALSLAKEFEFWKIRSYNKIVYQKTDNKNIVSLPELAFFSTTYYDKIINFKITGGSLHVITGFDLYFNTKYYINGYMPSTGVFFQQTQEMKGNYPYLNVFLNIRLKRTRFFFKYEHVNEGMLPREYFTVLHYPNNNRTFKFGISWTFYN